MDRTVTLTDASGKALGSCALLDAHTGEGKLHRAFSVYVFNPDRTQMLIQRRASGKMLWPGFWANTCCSHPFEDESATDAGERRLREELGITSELRATSSFVYRAEDPDGRGVEHEHVTILVGELDPSAPVTADPEEVMEYRWVNIDDLLKEMASDPDRFAPWFHLGLAKLVG